MQVSSGLLAWPSMALQLSFVEWCVRRFYTQSTPLEGAKAEKGRRISVLESDSFIRFQCFNLKLKWKYSNCKFVFTQKKEIFHGQFTPNLKRWLMYLNSFVKQRKVSSAKLCKQHLTLYMSRTFAQKFYLLWRHTSRNIHPSRLARS